MHPIPNTYKRSVIVFPGRLIPATLKGGKKKETCAGSQTLRQDARFLGFRHTAVFCHHHLSTLLFCHAAQFLRQSSALIFQHVACLRTVIWMLSPVHWYTDLFGQMLDTHTCNSKQVICRPNWMFPRQVVRQCFDVRNVSILHVFVSRRNCVVQVVLFRSKL